MKASGCCERMQPRRGNGYRRTLLCFVQLFVVSNRDSTYYFANTNARHFRFNEVERFLGVCQNSRFDQCDVSTYFAEVRRAC